MAERAAQDVAELSPDDSVEPERDAVPKRESVMVIDVDPHVARAVLFDLVDGVPRFVGAGSSPSTHAGQTIDYGRVWLAIRELEQQSGRRLVSDDQIISPQSVNGDGVDELFLTGLPVDLNRAAVISIGNGGLGKHLVAGIRRTPTVVAFAAEDVVQTTATVSSPKLLMWLREIAPKTLILVDDGGTVEDWDIAIGTASDAARDGVMSTGIVIADHDRQQMVARSLGTMIELSGIDPLEFESWEVATALESAFNDDYNRRVRSLDSIPALSNARYVDRLRSIQAVASFLHRRMHRNVISLSIGSGSLIYSASNGGGTTSFRAERDLELGARSLLRFSPGRVTRWVPYRWSEEDLTQWILNRVLRPFCRPDSTTDSLVDSALRREIIADLMDDAGLNDRSDIDLVVVGPSFADLDPSLVAMTVIDGVAPQPADGVVTIALDAEGIMASVGAVSTLDPVFARNVIEQDFLVPMATCVVVAGDGEEGALAVRGEITLEDAETRRFSVPFGNVHLLDVSEGEAAEVTLTTEPGFTIGAHGSGETVEFVGDRKLFGGRAGIIVDARGRPIRVPEDSEARVAILRSWLSDAGSPTE